MAFVLGTKDGFMKHTFTGLRKAFPNLIMHKIINEAIVPFRVELIRRTETGGESILTDSLRTYMLNCLHNLRIQIQDHANTAVFDPDATLAQRMKRRDEYINRILDKENTAEKEVRRPEFSHSDELLESLDASVHSVTFDYTGTRDLDFVQPTPERVQNPVLRQVLVAIDRFVVQMSISHSADNPRTILADDAARWISDLDNIYAVVDKYDPGLAVFHPTALSLNERENMFNADGSHDFPVTQGTATGEVDNTPRRNFDTSVQSDVPKPVTEG